MHVTALAEALAGARRPDGTISLHQLDTRLTRTGLEELARAAASLPNRPGRAQDVAADPEHAWF